MKEEINSMNLVFVVKFVKFVLCVHLLFFFVFLSLLFSDNFICIHLLKGVHLLDLMDVMASIDRIA